MKRQDKQSTIFLMLFIFTGIIMNASVAAANNEKAPILIAHLSGDIEGPPAETGAQGKIVFQLSEDGNELYYKLSVVKVEKATAAHIYLAPKGEIARVIVSLFDLNEFPRIGNFNGEVAEGIITADKLVGPLVGSSLTALLREMGGGHTYVNVLTKEHPQGYIRGRIETPLN
jgi:hypothetical protein